MHKMHTYFLVYERANTVTKTVDAVFHRYGRWQNEIHWCGKDKERGVWIKDLLKIHCKTF